MGILLLFKEERFLRYSPSELERVWIKWLRIMSGYTLATKTYMSIHVSSNLQKANCKIVCCEKALKPITPSWCFIHQWQREKNFGMGKVNWMMTIGNSHTSQKRCQRLNDDWCLNSVQMLKVQSSLQGNLKGYTDGRFGFTC